MVDRLYGLIQIYKFDFDAASLGKFDYRMLMYNPDIPYGEKEETLVKNFRKASACLGNVGGDSLYDENSQYWLQIKNLRKETLQYGSVQYVTDVLIRGLFKENTVKRKAAFWACFGDAVYDNLSRNVPANTKMCARCGKRFTIDGHGEYCEDCEPLGAIIGVHTATCVLCGESFVTRNPQGGAICPACKMLKLTEEFEYTPGKNVKFCVDCGKPFETSTRGRPSIRCRKCQEARSRAKTRTWKLNHYGE